jgi:hypothetical protein
MVAFLVSSTLTGHRSLDVSALNAGLSMILSFACTGVTINIMMMVNSAVTMVFFIITPCCSIGKLSK